MCVDELTFRTDGSVVPLNMSAAGPAPAGTLNPYQRVEAESIAWAHGLKTREVGDRAGNRSVCDLAEGAHLRVRHVDFGLRPAQHFSLTLSSGRAGATVEVRLDRLDGPVVARVTVPDTQATWQTVSTTAEGTVGIHDLYFVFQGHDASRLAVDWWTFER